MTWTVRFDDEFEAEFTALRRPVQDELLAVAKLLADYGPRLGRPYADTLKGSKHANMKELRIQHRGRPYRVLFAFDPRRTAILLIGGNKTGKGRWYKEFVPIADNLYDEHLESLRREGSL